MRKKRKRIEKICPITIEGTANFIIEPEIVEYAKWLNDLMPERTQVRIEKEKGEQGFIGQELFNGFLLQYKIPNVYANPLYEDMKLRQMDGKHFDFIVPHMPEGKRIISVKTTPEGSNNVRFMANVESWKNEAHDIVIAIKIDSVSDHRAHIAGWLDSTVVESLPTKDFRRGLAYWTYLDPDSVNDNIEYEPTLRPLNPAPNIMEELLKGSFIPTKKG